MCRRGQKVSCNNENGGDCKSWHIKIKMIAQEKSFWSLIAIDFFTLDSWIVSAVVQDAAALKKSKRSRCSNVHYIRMMTQWTEDKS
jgi:hypothetical protein